MKPLAIGEVRVDAIVETAAVPMKFSEVLPGADPLAIAAERHWLEPHFATQGCEYALLSFHSYLVRTPRHTVLIDSCVGNDKDRGGFAPFHRLQTPWLERLERAGVAPDQVDFVLCTHMHSDHIGWNTRLLNGRWVPTFPRAKYLFARREYERSLAAYRAADSDFRAPAYADSVLPVVESGQALIVEDDHALDDSMQLEAAEGHTPGNVVIRLRSLGESAVFSGDVMHHPIQVRHPQWSAAFCEDPVLSAVTRRAFVEQHADTGTWILAAHFPDPTAGRIVGAPSRRGFRFADEDA
jgi:glyoxylase-like metal-dependent hydrolase (beta-lactamase superfamily II)